MHMNRLIYYKSGAVTTPEARLLPGMDRFASFFEITNDTAMPVDRTGTIRFPIRTHSLFSMPTLRPYTKSYSETCDERAVEILKRATALNVDVRVMWSGGIDSTVALVALLKNATTKEELQRIVVLLSEESISENPRFFEAHIHGKIRYDSAIMFPYLLGTKHILVSGTHNDLLFGKDIVGSIVSRFGMSKVLSLIDRDILRTFLAEKTGAADTAEFYIELFEKLRAIAPLPIDSIYNLFWWFDFCTNWQKVYTSILPFTAERNIPLITSEYVDTYYMPFFNTEDFQLWSMNNLDKRIKDTWESHKWPAKDMIYDFTKDAEYRDTKIKRSSLYFLIVQQKSVNFIDESFRFFDEATSTDYYDPKNDFRDE